MLDDRVISIYPGWYSGRTIHIHVRVRTYSGAQVYDEFTSQFFFDDAITDSVFTQPSYNTRRTRDTRNANDMVLQGMKNSSTMFLNLTKTDTGYAATIDMGLTLKTVTSKPSISANGIVNAASFQAGVAPGAWVSIFGQSLAASSHALVPSDLVNGNLPTTLSGVSVQVDNQAAFLQYVSPSQINVQAPADNNTGSVRVTVTNSGGTSDAAVVNLQSIQPAFFTSQNYVAAVRADGAIVNAATPAKSGCLAVVRDGIWAGESRGESGQRVSREFSASQCGHGYDRRRECERCLQWDGGGGTLSD